MTRLWSKPAHSELPTLLPFRHNHLHQTRVYQSPPLPKSLFLTSPNFSQSHHKNASKSPMPYLLHVHIFIVYIYLHSHQIFAALEKYGSLWVLFGTVYARICGSKSSEGDWWENSTFVLMTKKYIEKKRGLRTY